jgi:glucose/arabinose dehydrogenase
MINRMKAVKKYFIPLVIGTLLSFCLNAQVLPPGFMVQQINTLNFPTSMAFAPDGRIFLAEEAGTVKIFKGGVLLPTSFVQLDSVYSLKEKGLLGIAFDPDFVNNGYVYFYYTSNVSGYKYNGSTLAGTPVRNKIVRYTANGDVALTGSKKTIINFDVIPDFIVNYNHDGGTLQFGPDGKLYVAIGENTLWCASLCMNILSTGCNCGPTWVIQSWSQEMTSFHGKILRINPDGTAPTDNPFYSLPTPVDNHQKYFYAIGARNPFTMHFKKGTSDLYFNDVGSADVSSTIVAKEEVNKITPTGGKNFAWPNGEGVLSTSQYVDPIYTFPHRLYSNGGSNAARAAAGTTVMGCAITGGVYFQPSSTNWPAQYQSKYYAMDFCNGWINAVDIDNGGTVTNFASALAGNYANTSDGGLGSIYLEEGQDGQMYYLVRSQTTGQSGLYRISYQPVTVSSITIAGANVISVDGATLTFTGGSLPADASLNKILWSVTPTNLASVSLNGVISPKGNGVVTLTGRSSGDLTKLSSIVVTISGQIITTGVTITAPGNNFSITTDKGSVQLTGAIIPGNANQAINWSVVSYSNGADATISGTGLVTAMGNNGTVTVSGTSVSNPTISTRAVVTITGQFVQVTSIFVSSSDGSHSINTIGGVMTMTGAVQPINATNKNVNWSISSGADNASISGVGILIPLKDGLATVLGVSVSNNSISGYFALTITGQMVVTTTTGPLTVTSINDAKDIQNAQYLYPNPTTGLFTLVAKGVSEKVVIIAMNEQGQELYSEKVNFNESYQVNLSRLPKGFYRVSLVRPEGSFHYKLILQ